MVSVDWQRFNLVENFPLLGMGFIFLLMALPGIPQDLKGPLMMISLGGVMASTFSLTYIAQVQASVHNVLKARIMPYKIEREFHIKKTVGRIQSRYNPSTGKYVTPFELATPMTISALDIGEFDEFEIEHKLQWDTRNRGDQAIVHWKGIETQHANTILCELWYTGERSPKVGSSTNFLGFVPRFRLASGSEDFWLLNGQPIDENVMREPMNEQR